MINGAAVIACLEKAAGRKLAEPELVIHRISLLMNASLQLPPVPKACRLSFALYGLAVLYAEVTQKMPGYSKSENATHFERFVWLVLRPPEFLLTGSAVKTGIQKLALKQNPAFARDVQGAIGKWPDSGDTAANSFDA